MPFTKAYKRFNVGQYMKQKRHDWVAIQNKNKEIKLVAQNLRRLDAKVRNVLFLLIVCVL